MTEKRVVLQVRLKPEEKAEIKKAADLCGVTLTEFVKDCALVRASVPTIAPPGTAYDDRLRPIMVDTPVGRTELHAPTKGALKNVYDPHKPPEVKRPVQFKDTLFRCKWSDCDYGANVASAKCGIHGCKVVPR